MPLSRRVSAVVLGGGRGTRLHPLTRYRSKPAVPLGGQYRLIDVPISNCIHSSVRLIYVLTQYNSASLNHHINATFRFDEFSEGFVEILAAEQTPETEQWFQGTADAVRRNLTHILSRNCTHVLIMSGDCLWRQDFRELFEQHDASGAEVTVVCKLASSEEAPRLGIVQIDPHLTITGFVEKPSTDALPQLAVNPDALAPHLRQLPPQQAPYLASMGIYLFNRETLCSILQQCPDEDFGRQIIPYAIRQRNVRAYLFEDYWEDVGTISAFYNANLELLDEQPRYQFHHPTAPVFTRLRSLPSSEIRNCHLEQVFLGAGSRLRSSRIHQSVIGLRSQIHGDCDLDQVIMMGADYYEGESKASPAPPMAPPLGLGRGVVAKKAIIDKNARIGDGCQILNARGLMEYDGALHSIRDGVIIIPKGAILPPGTIL
jgi:glucose-1-phosphate adenylyltransferase